MAFPDLLHGTGKKGIEMEQKGGEIYDGKGIFPAFCPGPVLWSGRRQVGAGIGGAAPGGGGRGGAGSLHRRNDVRMVGNPGSDGSERVDRKGLPAFVSGDPGYFRQGGPGQTSPPGPEPEHGGQPPGIGQRRHPGRVAGRPALGPNRRQAGPFRCFAADGAQFRFPPADSRQCGGGAGGGRQRPALCHSARRVAGLPGFGVCRSGRVWRP